MKQKPAHASPSADDVIERWDRFAELYAAGYSRNVTQLVSDDDGFWIPEVVYTAQRPLHHLVAGEFDPKHPGPELVMCGHGGRLIALFPKAQ